MAKDLIRASASMGGVSVYYNLEQFTVDSELFGLSAYRKLRDQLVTPEMSKSDKDKISNEVDDFMMNIQSDAETGINQELKSIADKFDELVKGIVHKYVADAETKVNEYIKNRK